MAEKAELKQQLSSKEAELTRAQETIRREQQQNQVMREKVQEMEQEMEEMKLKMEEMEKQGLEYTLYMDVYMETIRPLACLASSPLIFMRVQMSAHTIISRVQRRAWGRG